MHQGSGPRHRGVKDEYGRNYKDPTRVFAPDEHGFASPIKSQSQGMTASSLTQADNSALNREILTADTREHMRLVADDDSDLESDNGTSDAVSAGDAILHDRSMPEVEEADAAVSTPQSSGDHAADTVEVRIFRISIASFVLFSTMGDMSFKSSLSTAWSYGSALT